MKTRSLKVTVALFLAAALALSADTRAEEGPLVGKPLPALALSHPVQGSAWQPSELLGSVVLLDFFQLG